MFYTIENGKFVKGDLPELPPDGKIPETQFFDGKTIKEITDRDFLVEKKEHVMKFHTHFNSQGDRHKAKYYSDIHKKACDRIRFLDANK